jgi:hypothetical protein
MSHTSSGFNNAKTKLRSACLSEHSMCEKRASLQNNISFIKIYVMYFSVLIYFLQKALFTMLEDGETSYLTSEYL